MVMKFMKMLQIKLLILKIQCRQYFYIIYFFKTKEETFMLKLLAKMAEKYAKSTNTACFMWFALHQPKMPASLVKKD